MQLVKFQRPMRWWMINLHRQRSHKWNRWEMFWHAGFMGMSNRKGMKASLRTRLLWLWIPHYLKLQEINWTTMQLKGPISSLNRRTKMPMALSKEVPKRTNCSASSICRRRATKWDLKSRWRSNYWKLGLIQGTLLDCQLMLMHSPKKWTPLLKTYSVKNLAILIRVELSWYSPQPTMTMMAI